MVSQNLDLALIRRACGQAAVAYFCGGADSFDPRVVLLRLGIERPEELIDDPHAPLEARQLMLAAPGLVEATRRLAGAAIEGAREALPRAVALAELARSADEQRLRAVARALVEADAEALEGPLDEAYAASRGGGDLPGQTRAEQPGVSAAQLAELLEEPPARTLPSYRLVVSRLRPAPAPPEAWRAELRPLIRDLLEPHGTSLGIGPTTAPHGPAAFCAPHFQRPERLMLYARAANTISLARSLAAAVGLAVAHGASRPDRSYALAALFAARLASTSLWRRVGLGRGPARDAARQAGQSLLGLLVRVAAYAEHADDEARAQAAAAGALLREHDDLAAALRWRGPYPDPLGLPLPCGGPRLFGLLVGAVHGLRWQQGLREALGDDWHRAPEAGELLWELAEADDLPAVEQALVALLEG